MVALALLTATLPSAARSYAEQVLDKTISKLVSAPGVTCRFEAQSNGQSVNGSMKTSGRKFQIKSPASSTWYDGRQMWTANAQTKEITLVVPSAEELSEVNPFAYLSNVKGQYKVGYSKRKETGRHLIVLNPKTKNSGIKAVEIAIDSKTLLPERFIIRNTSNQVTTIQVSGLSLKGSGNSEFTCPVKSMSNYELVDLR